MKKASSKTTAPAMRDNSGFTGGVRGKYAVDSGRREAGGKELAMQKAEGQGCGNNRCEFWSVLRKGVKKVVMLER